MINSFSKQKRSKLFPSNIVAEFFLGNSSLYSKLEAMVAYLFKSSTLNPKGSRQD